MGADMLQWAATAALIASYFVFLMYWHAKHFAASLFFLFLTMALSVFFIDALVTVGEIKAIHAANPPHKELHI